MKLRFRFLALAVCLLAVVTGAMAQNCTPSQSAFDSAYWLAQPTAVQALQTADPADGANGSFTASTKYTTAVGLANKGYVIDVPIMVWGWDACLTMQLRQQYGFTTVPSALQGGPAIKVSTNAADYPPFNPPPPPPNTAPPKVLVGAQSFGNVYLTVPGDTSPDGTKYTDARGAFVKHVIPTPFGNESYWELQPPAATPSGN